MSSTTRRQLKFRIFNTQTRKITEMDSLHWFEEYHAEPDGMASPANYIRDTDVVDQWTGIVDKYGTLIYENDIVNFTGIFIQDGDKFFSDPSSYHKNRIVSYDEKSTSFIFGNHHILDGIQVNTIEVVSNIYKQQFIEDMLDQYS